MASIFSEHMRQDEISEREAWRAADSAECRGCAFPFHNGVALDMSGVREHDVWMPTAPSRRPRKRRPAVEQGRRWPLRPCLPRRD